MTRPRRTEDDFKRDIAAKHGAPLTPPPSPEAMLAGATPPTFYIGLRTADRCEVFVLEPGRLGRRLPFRLDLANHSPDGFNWGYNGSGPAQLALALLADALKNDRRAVQLHQQFKFRVIGPLACTEWTMSSEFIRKVVGDIERENKARNRR
jgi:hypothetical protein